MSINDRLGALCDNLGAEPAGAALTPLTMDWLAEMVPFAMADAEDIESRMPGTELEEEDA